MYNTCVNVSMTGAGFLFSRSPRVSMVLRRRRRRRRRRPPPLSPHAIRIHIRLHLDLQGLSGEGAFSVICTGCALG